MKNCHSWIIGCVLVALAVVFVLPKFGLPLAGASLMIPLLLIGCCVLPVVMMAFASTSKEKGGCCDKKDNVGTTSLSAEQKARKM